MHFDPNNRLPIGARVYISKIPKHSKFNEGIIEGDTGIIVQNKIFEYTYLVKVDKEVDERYQPVYSNEIELLETINCEVPNWDQLSTL